MRLRVLSEDDQQLLRHRGVPVDVFRMKPFSFMQQLAPIVKRAGAGERQDRVHGSKSSRQDKNERTINPDVQFKMFKSSVEEIQDGQARNWIYCMSSLAYSDKTRFAALHIMATMIRAQREELTNDALPYWHLVKGGFYDDLRDNRENRVSVGRPSLLILDGLAVNSSDIKLEKTRDLLAMYSNIPRIVITCGVDPISFMQQTLFYKVNRVMYFTDRKTVEI